MLRIVLNIDRTMRLIAGNVKDQMRACSIAPTSGVLLERHIHDGAGAG